MVEVVAHKTTHNSTRWLVIRELLEKNVEREILCWYCVALVQILHMMGCRTALTTKPLDLVPKGPQSVVSGLGSRRWWVPSQQPRTPDHLVWFQRDPNRWSQDQAVWCRGVPNEKPYKYSYSPFMPHGYLYRPTFSCQAKKACSWRMVSAGKEEKCCFSRSVLWASLTESHTSMWKHHSSRRDLS